MSLSTVNNLKLLMRHGIVAKLIKENPDDPRIDEPKRQLAVLDAEIDRRNIKRNEDGSFDLPKREVVKEIEKNNLNQVVKMDSLNLTAKSQLKE